MFHLVMIETVVREREREALATSRRRLLLDREGSDPAPALARASLRIERAAANRPVRTATSP